MAEVRLCVGRGAQDFALKVHRSYLLESQGKQKSIVQTSCLSVGFLLDDIKNCDLNGVKNAADGAAAGAYEDSYTRVEGPVGSADACSETRKVAEKYCSRGLDKQSSPRKLRLQLIDRNVPRYRSDVRFWRTSCSPYHRCSGHLHRGDAPLVFVREYSGNGTISEPLYRTKTGYYDILEVSPTSTQAQIKTAYYKQSFIYHPDRNCGSGEATARFSEISEAYAVLGNKGLRKKYDRGLLSLSDLTATVRPSAKDTTGGSAKQQADGGRSVAATDFRRGVFDFDQFYRSHYSEQLQRQKEIRVRRDEILKRQTATMGDKKLGKMTEIGVGMLLIIGVGILMTLKRG